MRERRRAGERRGGGGVRDVVRERGRETVSKVVFYAQSTSAVISERERVNWCFTPSAVISERARVREKERGRENKLVF